MAGFVYIMSNPAFPDRIKIGKSDRDPDEFRKSELHSTGVPEPFQVEYYAYVNDHHSLERRVHRHFAKQRPNQNREFFTCSVMDAITFIQEEAHDEIKYEENHYAEYQQLKEEAECRREEEKERHKIEAEEAEQDRKIRAREEKKEAAEREREKIRQNYLPQFQEILKVRENCINETWDWGAVSKRDFVGTEIERMATYLSHTPKYEPHIKPIMRHVFEEARKMVSQVRDDYIKSEKQRLEYFFKEFVLNKIEPHNVQRGFVVLEKRVQRDNLNDRQGSNPVIEELLCRAFDNLGKRLMGELPNYIERIEK